MVEKILRGRTEKKIESILIEDQFGFGRRRGNMDSENSIITSLGHRRSLYFVAINFFFMIVFVNSIKSLDHSPLTCRFFISCIVSLRPAFPKSLSTSTSTSLFSVASLSLNFLVASSLILLQNLRAFLLSTYFFYSSDFQVFWSISCIVELWNVFLPNFQYFSPI
jgi:hypothetical protein